MKEINLGREREEYDIPMNPRPVMEEEKETEIIYPCMYIDRAPDELLNMPDEGTATIHYSIKEMTKGDRGNRMELEIMSIKPTGGPKLETMDESEDAGTRFDKFMEERE